MNFTKTVLLLLILSNLSLAQISNSNIYSQKEFYKNEIKLHQQLLMCEQQTTENQENFDVTYYSLDLIPDPVTSTLTGVVEIEGEVVSAALDYVEMNFADVMNITQLYKSDAQGTQLNYTHNNDILLVNLEREYVQGESFSITVSYNGRPQDSEEFGWGFGFDTHAGQPMIWSFSQPWGARAWWPCKDVPSDKADSVDIRVTVPNNLIVASNGSLIETTTNDNNTTYWWHEKYPIATYLVSLAIYPYEVHYDNYVYNDGNDVMQIHFYTFPGYYEYYYDINMKVKDMLAYFSEIFGQYPFIDEKYGHADFTEGGAMEHQTLISYHFYAEWLYAHELAHQWWGDMVTYENWHHTWFSEGLATYAEALWHEHNNGPGTANDYQMDENLYFGPGTIYVEEPETFTEAIDSPLYPGLIYEKASWVIHMLRHIVGEENFFNILLALGADPGHNYGTATTESIQAVCEEVSGMDLEQFFHQWIYEEYYPIYSYTWSWNQNGPNYEVNLEIQQEQENYFFHMPIDVTITTAVGETTFVAENNQQVQSYQFTVTSEPTGVELDKNNWILKIIREPFIDPPFDQGILLVNGVSFDVYGQEILNSYDNLAFTGEFPFSFWDCFDAPTSGYPSSLPQPLGHGKVSTEILSRYSTVIWVGNDYEGDLSKWKQTPIPTYLQSGGNLILLTRKGRDFLDTDLQEYLGIIWEEEESSTLQNCVASYPGLLSNVLTGTQNTNAVFNTELTSDESTLLFVENYSFGVPRGVGVWHKPAGGRVNNINGGQFVFISGRPYRYHYDQLSTNIEFILDNFFNESRTTGVNDNPEMIPNEYYLDQNFPNPFNPATTISYSLPQSSDVSLKVYNFLGQEIRVLVNEFQSPGYKSISWDGTNNSGKRVSSGIYFYKLSAGDYTTSKKMILMK